MWFIFYPFGSLKIEFGFFHGLAFTGHYFFFRVGKTGSVRPYSIDHPGSYPAYNPFLFHDREYCSPSTFMVVVIQLMRFLVLLLLCGCVSAREEFVYQNIDVGFATVGYCEIYVPFRDGQYSSFSREEAIRLPKFKAEKNEARDCDESAYRAFVYVFNLRNEVPAAFGVAYVEVGPNNPFKISPTENTKHALNFFMDGSMDLYLYEPQNGTFFEFKEALQKGYIKRVITLIL